MRAYVGSRTTVERNARGEGISVFECDRASGRLELIQVVGQLKNPSYLAINAAGRRLYCVHGDTSDVSAFEIHPEGELRLINRQSTEGHNPVHLTIDRSGHFLLVTNHLASTLVVLPIDPSGALEPVVQTTRIDGPVGPHRDEQTQPKPHFELFDRGGHHVIVPDKGLDRVFSFSFRDGRLEPADPAFVQARAGCGPRHAAFHPAKPFAYVVNELDSSLTTYAYDPANAGLTPLDTRSTLPSSFTGNSRGAGIAIDASGRTVYASNRGHDSIAVFRLDNENAIPELTDAVMSGGRTPRFFTLAPDGRLLFALNEDSDTIFAFDVDAASGGLSARRLVAECRSPVCMVFSGTDTGVQQ